MPEYTTAIYKRMKTKRWGWNPIKKKYCQIYGFRDVLVGYEKMTPQEIANAKMFADIRVARNADEIDEEEEEKEELRVDA